MADYTKQQLAVIVGKKIRTRRKRKRWSQAKLAELAGVSKDTVKSYEQGRRLAQMDKARDLAEALGVPLSELLP